MPQCNASGTVRTALGIAGLVMLGACHSDEPPVHGKVVLCPTAAVVGPASIVVSNSSDDKPVVKTVARDTPAAGVCAAIAEAATAAGFKTETDDPGQAAVKILDDDPERIMIDVKNIRILTQTF